MRPPAAVIYYDLFVELDVIRPNPRSCHFIPRSTVTCKCGVGLYRRAPNLCDDCNEAYFAPVQDLIDAENGKAPKVRPAKQKEAPVAKTRSWRPPPAPKVKQTWKKAKK